jgi:phospholipase D1/2
VEYLPSTLVYDAESSDPIVPGTYFRPRLGSQIRFYIGADANDKDDGLPDLICGDENPRIWKRQRCWRDIYDSFVSAKTFIYITGWSVDHKQSLLRGDELNQTLNNSLYSPFVGELLKKKALENVVVNILVWDDATSNMLNQNGVMGTLDEELRRFFADSPVTVKLVAIGSGEVDTKCGENARNAVIFTHHQKSIICDDGDGGLVGYVGGIDLTAGRYDTRRYTLFRSLQHEHANDFYNNCAINARQNVGPREPWHDIHSRVEGPAAIDLLQNFEERWRRQAASDVDKLVDLEKVGVKPEVAQDEHSWTTQLFRSIDARTALFDANVIANFKAPSFEDIDGVSFDDESIIDSVGTERNPLKLRHSRPAYKQTFTASNTDGFDFHQCLRLEKGLQYDQSCAEALIYYIRNAQHVVYIESQYFLSSSHIWPHDKATKCRNLVAAELTWKICSKIENGERFAAYIVVPMWPEGVPDSHAVQDVLHLQSLTIAGMYRHIAKSIARAKKSNSNESASDIKPTDYLNFYCLANRETEDGSQSVEPPRKNTWEEIVWKTRRHLIYVHAKMAIFDDAVALIGSANINERSLSGTRDTELSQASWQPAHLATKGSIAHGDVHAFRIQCWMHTTGMMEDVFRRPASLDCVRRINDIAEDNWKRYVQDEVCEMHSYLVPYPIKIATDGTISARTKDGCFPDTKAKILGRRTFLPKLLTT